MTTSQKKEILRVGIFYTDIDKGGGYPRDVLRLLKELDQKDEVSITKVKSILHLFSSIREFDCVHIFGFFTFHIVLASLLCVFFNKKYVISVLGQLLPRALANGEQKKMLFINNFGRFIFRKASRIHVFTDYEANELKKLQIKTPTFKGFFGIYPEDVKPEKGELPFVKERPFLLFFGRLDVHQKGLDILLDGFEKYSKENEQFDLVISGRDYNNGNLYIKNFLKSTSLNGRVHLIGEVTEGEKESLFSEADAIIYPCHFDGNPRPLRHALCRRKKILTTFQSNFSDQLEQKNWGVLFENTSESLARGIERFEKISVNTPYEEPGKTRSWEYCSTKFKTAYLSLLR